VKSLFDSSVLVAALLETHPSHKTSRAIVLEHRGRSGEFAISQHALLETYAVLTGMRTRPRLTPPMVRLAMTELLAPAEVVPLSPSDYQECLMTAESSNLIGGAICDLLHLRAAEIWGAAQLVTLNPKHFRPLAGRLRIAVAEP